MLEEWRNVPGFEGNLQVSNEGNLRTIDRLDFRGRPRKGKILKVHTQKTGHLRIKISYRGIQKSYSIHRLVAMTWIPNPDNLPVVNHLDSNPGNNKIENLEWTTFLGNMLHAVNKGRLVCPYGETAHHFKSRVIVLDLEGNTKDILCGNRDMLEKGYDYRLVSACLLGKQLTHRGCTFRREVNETSSNTDN